MTLYPSPISDSETSGIAGDSDSAYSATRPNMVSSDILCEIEKLVNYAIQRIAKSWNLSEDDRLDLRQDAIVTAIEAYHRFDPARGRKRANWLLDRIIGQITDSLQRLRSGGIVGGMPIVFSLNAAPLLSDPTPSDEQPGRELSAYAGNGEPGQVEPIDGGLDPSERADIARAMETLGEALGTVDKRILTLYYGLGGGREHTVSELGERLGCSRKHAFNLLQIARKHAREALL